MLKIEWHEMNSEGIAVTQVSNWHWMTLEFSLSTDRIYRKRTLLKILVLVHGNFAESENHREPARINGEMKGMQ